MKRVLLGTLIGTVIFFAAQAVMWVGGIHNDFSAYTPKQDSVLQDISKWNLDENLYFLPYHDPNVKATMEEHHKAMQANVGKPWAMLFYHKAMEGEGAANMIKGAAYSLVACLVTALILAAGRFNSFFSRFLVAMGISVFAVMMGPMVSMNWWSMPWGFIKAQIIDLTFCWGLAALWLAFYVKGKTANS